MKNPSNDLFQLIQSLSKSEKRYFKLFATRHFDKDNQYLKLFEAIETQLTYQEALLVPIFSEGKSAAHFAVLKKQLYESLLEALHRFDEFDDVEQQLAKGVHYCTILLKRGLLTQCKKQILRYKQLGYKLEKFELIIELIEIEKRLGAKLQYSGMDENHLQAMHEEQLFCLQQIQLTGLYWLKSAGIYQLHYAKKIIPGKENVILNTTIAEPLFTQSEAATTFKAKLDQLQIQALHAFVQRDVNAAFNYNAQFLHLMDEHVHLKQIYAERYFSALNNYLIDCLILQRHEDLLSGIITMRQLPLMEEFRHIQHLDANVFRLSYLLEMNYYVGKNDFENALTCANYIQQGIKKYAAYIAKPNIITLNYLCAYTHFCNRNFNACLDVLLNLFAIKESESITDLYCDSKMMQMLCHFELGDILLINSLITAFNRLTTIKKVKTQTYKVVIKYMRQTLRNPDKKTTAGLLTQLQELAEKETEKNTFNNFNYFYWLEKVRKL
ncbi:MAG: hypothetical protein V9F05_11800 [Chitinophagaceae bacterium]